MPRTTIRDLLLTAATAGALGLSAPALADDASAPGAGNAAGTDSVAPGGDFSVAAGSDLEGMTYDDLQGRTLYSSDSTEMGTVANARVNDAGAIDALVVRGTDAFDMDQEYMLIPVGRISPAQGDDGDLVSDISDEDVRRAIEAKQSAGEGSGTVDKEIPTD
jgi:sporulation protein YlmC with PRC-barrel domain